MFDICDCSYLILERAFLLESNTFSSFCDSLYSFVRFFFLFLFRYVKNGPHHSDKPSSSRESIEDDPFIAASTYSQNSVDRRDRKRDSSVNYGYQPDGRELRLKPAFLIHMMPYKANRTEFS